MAITSFRGEHSFLSNFHDCELKAWGKTVDLRSDWSEVRLQVMEDILRIKFSQEQFKQKLLATGNEELVEGNWWHDKFWGQCPVGTGENHLGKLLMKIRKELQNI